MAAEANPQLFATMCALVASGFEAEGVSDIPELAQLQTRLLALHGPSTEAMRAYYRQHAFSDSGATLSRFLTFALVAGPAPDFRPSIAGGGQLPPDVIALDGFGPVLAAFYKEAQIEQIWSEFEPAYDRAAANMREPLTQIVFACTGYLREILHPGARKFRVYVEPMVGGETNVRNIGDLYVVVVNPAAVPVDRIRHAFLHYMLDPLPITYHAKLLKEEPLLVLADRAPNLPFEYRLDLTSFFTECLVRAVEYRVRKIPQAQLTEIVDTAEGNGYVLLRPLLQALTKFEASQPSMTLYFPDLVVSIDTLREQQRLRTVTFTPESEGDEADEVAESRGAGKGIPRAPGSSLEAELSAAERMIGREDSAAAAEAFENILAKSPGQPLALYGLAVASVLQGDAEHATALFQQVVAAANAAAPEMRPDPTVLAWSHIYLGRMHDLADDREQAVGEYRAALGVQNASEGARSAAQKGIEQAYKPAARGPSPQ